MLYKKGDPQDIGNYRPICLLSVVYKLFTRVILNRIERTLDEGQPCEQAGFRKGFSTIDHIHTVTRLIEVSREYKMPLCLTFIDLKKAFDSVETEAVLETRAYLLNTSRYFVSSTATSRPGFLHSTTTSPSTSREGFGKAIPCRQNYSAPLSKTSCGNWNGIAWECKLMAGDLVIFASLTTSFL